MRVAVIGAGGIGSVFGGRLAAAGHDVWLIHRRREVVDALQRDGLRLDDPDNHRECIPVRATTNTHEVEPVDLVVIATKTTDTRSAAEAARPILKAETLVLTLQNGLGNLETIADVVGIEHCLVGMTYLGATVAGPGHVRFTVAGQTFVGEPQAQMTERAHALADSLDKAGLPTQATDRLWEMVWGKLVINAALNATCALTGASGETALASDAASAWLGLVADETAAVARELGVSLPYTDAAARVRQHCRDVGRAKPSMLQDMERGRPTEIDAINGAVVREGRRLGVPTPYNEALLLLVKAREEVNSV